MYTEIWCTDVMATCPLNYGVQTIFNFITIWHRTKCVRCPFWHYVDYKIPAGLGAKKKGGKKKKVHMKWQFNIDSTTRRPNDLLCVNVWRLSFHRKFGKFILVLIPLFGIMYIVLNVAFPSEVQGRGYNVVYLYIEMGYNSFQVCTRSDSVSVQW